MYSSRKEVLYCLGQGELNERLTVQSVNGLAADAGHLCMLLALGVCALVL